EALQRGFGPCVGGLAPGVALLLAEVGEVHSAVTAARLEVVECLGSSVKIENGLEAVARPLDRGDALWLRTLEFRVAFGKRGDVVDEHCVENGVLVYFL